MAPSLIASYFLQQNTTGTATLTTASFTPANGEVIIVKLGTWDTGNAMSAPTGGGQTYASRLIVAPGGFKEWCGIYTATISGSPGAMTISSSPPVSGRYSMVVERWSSATLDTTPATNSGGTVVGVSSAAASTLTTTAANSVISWVCTDVNSTDPVTRAFLGSGTEDGLRDGHSGANGVEYFGYQPVASAGATSFGLSAPTTMSWSIAGIEIKDATSVDATITPAAVAATAAVPAPAVSVSATVSPAAVAATAAVPAPRSVRP